MLHPPLVSVIIPLFNKEKYISATIESVVNQSYQYWELIIIDDESTDDSFSRVMEYVKVDNRIRLLRRHGCKKGGQVCRNQGTKISEGDYIIYLDADDSLAVFCLAQRVLYMDSNPELDFSIFPQLTFYRKPGDCRILVNNLDSGLDDLSRFLTFGGYVDVPWITSSPIWRKRSLIKNNLYWEESLLGYQDVDFHIRALLLDMKYKKIKTQPDCYWRRGVDHNVGSKLKERKYLKSTCYLLSSLCEELIANNMLTRSKKRILATTFLHFMVRMKEKNMLYEFNIIKGYFYNHLSVFPHNIIFNSLMFSLDTMNSKCLYQGMKKYYFYFMLKKYRNLAKERKAGFMKSVYTGVIGNIK